MNHQIRTSRSWRAAWRMLIGVCAWSQASAWAQAKDNIVFEAKRDAAHNGATLDMTHVHPAADGPSGTLDIDTGADPYAKTEWRFWFCDPSISQWDHFFVEIEFVDSGAGVIQPVALKNAAFKGEWTSPIRSVSFTRLNTQKVRTALFEFSAPPVASIAAGPPQLKIAGLQGLKSLRARRSVSETRWKALAESVPVHVEPMVSLRRPMAITCTVGVPDVGYPPSLETALNNIREYAPLARLLGFTSAECFVRWDLIEPRLGEFDFRHYDQIVDALRRRGLRWYPNLVITSAMALPTWYYESPQNVGMRCIEHHEVNQSPSIWNDANRAHVTRVLNAFGAHYGPMGVLEAIRLGPSGNFGEAQYPAGAGSALGYQGAKMHAHIGWWAADPCAQRDFQQFLSKRYAAIAELNRAWDEHFAAFGEITPQLPTTYRTRRARLDITEWYTGSMTAWCDFWAASARAALPQTPIYQSSGGWGYREAGTDFSAQSESMKAHGGGIRLTNETDSFEQNVYATRLAATAARLFGIRLGYEPAGYHSARGVSARFFSTVTTNADNLYTRHSVLFEDPYSVENWLREYPLLDQRAAPVVDVAVYYPETMNQVDDGAFRNLYAWGFNPRAAEIRRHVDVDYLDERLIRRGFLDRYRALVFCWGNVIESDVQNVVDAWMKKGGTVIYPSYPRGPQETSDGKTDVFRAWERGDTGQGAFRRFQSDMEPITLYGDFVEQVLMKTSNLRPETRRMLSVRRPARVFVSALENGHAFALNYNDTPSEVSLDGEFKLTVPPYMTVELPGTAPSRP